MDNLTKLLECYQPPFLPPKWIKDFYSSDEWDKYAETTTVYYEKGEEESITQLIKEREPTNIAMNRSYNKNKLKEHFGFSKGFYETYYDVRETLAPNIAIYSLTPFEYQDNSFIPLHVINVIGFAFDSKEQPDYKYFISHQSEILPRYIHVFNKIFRCAIDHKFECIVLSLFGLNNFASLYPDKSQLINWWMEAFETSLKRHRPYLQEGGAILLMGGGSNGIFSLCEKIRKIVLDNKLYYGEVGYLPDIIQEIGEEFSLNSTLFVNAWDPFSFVGNGNEADNSLDGHIGRRSALSILCWCETNDKMKFVGM